MTPNKSDSGEETVKLRLQITQEGEEWIFRDRGFGWEPYERYVNFESGVDELDAAIEQAIDLMLTKQKKMNSIGKLAFDQTREAIKSAVTTHIQTEKLIDRIAVLRAANMKSGIIEGGVSEAQSFVINEMVEAEVKLQGLGYDLTSPEMRQRLAHYLGKDKE